MEKEHKAREKEDKLCCTDKNVCSIECNPKTRPKKSNLKCERGCCE